MWMSKPTHIGGRTNQGLPFIHIYKFDLNKKYRILNQYLFEYKLENNDLEKYESLFIFPQ